MRSIAEELEWYRERTPIETLMHYRKENAPEDVTKEVIRSLIVGIAKTTRSLREIDSKLGEILYSSNLSINKYFSDEARMYLQANSPSTLTIGGEQTRIHYDNGQPYVTAIMKRQRAAINGAIFLEDGREVLLQFQSRSEGVQRVSFGSLKSEIVSE